LEENNDALFGTLHKYWIAAFVKHDHVVLVSTGRCSGNYFVDSRVR
jgi:hypothetical protein